MSRRSQVAEHVAVVPLFYGSTRRELSAISRLATEIDVPAGKVLTEEGKVGQEFMIVLSGTAVARKKGTQVATFGPGDFFGEIALLDPGLRTATVTAETPMTIAVVGPREFGAILDEVPTLSHKVMRALAKRLRAVDDVEVV